MLLVLSDRTVDLDARRVRTDDETLDLTPREAGLLACLLEHAGQTVSRDTLLAEVWGITRPVVTRCVDTAVRRLRVKLEANPSAPRHLQSVPGEGYRLEVDRPVEQPEDGRAPQRARLLAALQAYQRVYVVGPPGCDAEGLVRAAASERGWRIGEDLSVLSGPTDQAPSGREVVLGPAPPGAPVVPLPPLVPSAARATLLRACQRLGLLGDPDLEGLLRMCDAQPVVLARVADWLQVSPPAAVRARLADPVAAFPDLAEALPDAWESLDEQARRALAALAAIEGGLAMSDLPEALGVSLAVADRLVRAGWLSGRGEHLAPSLLQHAWVRTRRPDPDARARWAAWLPQAWLERIRVARAEGTALPRHPPEVVQAVLDSCARSDPAAAATVCRALDAVHIVAGHPPGVVDRFGEVLDLPLAPDDRAMLLRMRGTALRRQGRLRAALRDLDEAVAIAEDAGERGLCTAWRGTLHQVAQDYEAADRDLRAALREVDNDRQRIACETALAVVEATLGQTDAAVARARLAGQEARELGHEHLVLLADRCLGTVLVEVGHGVEARPRLERSARLAERLGAARQRLLCWRDLARASLDEGDGEAAVARLEDATELADGIASGWIEADLAELRALANWLEGGTDVARTWLERALVLRTDELPATAGTTLAWLALWYGQRRDAEEAARLWHRAAAARWPGSTRRDLLEAVGGALDLTGRPEGPPHGWYGRILGRILASHRDHRAL